MIQSKIIFQNYVYLNLKIFLNNNIILKKKKTKMPMSTSQER